MTGLEKVATIIGIVIAAAGVLAALVRAERRGRRMVNRLLGDGERPGALDKLDQVWDQVHPNHGTSLRDAVDRVERAFDAHVAAPLDRVHPRR